MLHVSIPHCMPEKISKTSKTDNSCLFVWSTVHVSQESKRENLPVSSSQGFTSSIMFDLAMGGGSDTYTQREREREKKKQCHYRSLALC